MTLRFANPTFNLTLLPEVLISSNQAPEDSTSLPTVTTGPTAASAISPTLADVSTIYISETTSPIAVSALNPTPRKNDLDMIIGIAMIGAGVFLLAVVVFINIRRYKRKRNPKGNPMY